MPAKLRSRFPQIVAQLKPRVDVALAEVSERIANDARGRVPVATGKLRDAIHVERDGVGEYRVVAGDDEVFYGHMVEFGTSHNTPRPFLVPAAEAHREAVQAIGAAALKGL